MVVAVMMAAAMMMNTEPPPAPLYLHDLADFLHAHILTHSSSTSHYDHLRTLYNKHTLSRLHTSYPRPVPQSTYVQHLFQAVLTLTPQLLQQLCCSTYTPIEIAPKIALLTLLYVTQPHPQQQIRITQKSLESMSLQAASSLEAAQLLNYLFTVHAFRIVPYLLHAPAHAPNNLVANPFPPLLRYWRPSLMYGYQVSLHAAVAALNDKFIPLCPSARAACTMPKRPNGPDD